MWLNTAHQGPLPLAAGAAAAQAGELKQFPHRMADADFTEVPERLRALLGRLVGADPAEIVLGDNTSHGIHVIANGLRFAPVTRTWWSPVTTRPRCCPGFGCVIRASPYAMSDPPGRC